MPVFEIFLRAKGLRVIWGHDKKKRDVFKGTVHPK